MESAEQDQGFLSSYGKEIFNEGIMWFSNCDIEVEYWLMESFYVNRDKTK